MYKGAGPEMRQIGSSVGEGPYPVDGTESHHVDFYCEHDDCFADALIRDLGKSGIGVAVYTSCLCRLYGIDKARGNLARCVISSPERSEECWERIAVIVDQNPETKFYVIDTLIPEREQVIAALADFPANLRFINDKTLRNGVLGELEQDAAL
jgi:hypothetical protein